jgi:hypothetical protein
VKGPGSSATGPFCFALRRALRALRETSAAFAVKGLERLPFKMILCHYTLVKV